MAKVEFYIKRAIVRRWKRVASGSSGMFAVFSPYITSRTAETVLFAHKKKQECHVYTLFDADVFQNRSSSLPTLRRLLKEGVVLYSLPTLHAKVIVVPESFASIGSQNLTAGGTTHLEATVVTTGIDEVAAIWREVEEWRRQATVISAGMIDDMQSLLVPFVRKARRMRRAMKDIDKEIEKRELLRRQQERDNDQAHKDRMERQRRLRLRQDKATANWRETPKARRIVRAKVAVDPRQFTTDSVTLRPTVAADLTEWLFEDGTSVSLDGYCCYPCMISNEWKLGFARVTKTRMTFIGKSISWSHLNTIANRQFGIGLEADWSDSEERTANVYCRLSFPSGKLAVTIPMWFDLHSLQIVGASAIDKALTEGDNAALAEWIATNNTEIEQQVLLQLLTPFTYSTPLDQHKATRFFGPVGTRYRLSVGKVNSHPVIVATKTL